MNQRFASKRAVVTGAARGIGAAIAKRLMAEGARVLAVDRLPFSPEEAYGELATNARTLTLDLTEANAPAILAAEAAEDGPVDILINNAGIGGARSIDETTDADWQRFIDTDLTAVFRVTRDLLPFIAAPGGRIVSIASIFGIVGFPGSLAYGVAKAGVAQMTRQLAADLSPRGILVNAVAPGVIETDMTHERIHHNAWYQKIQVRPTPVGRTGTPDDIAAAAAFLCSDDATFIAGHVLVVDGGWSAARYLAPEDV